MAAYVFVEIEIHDQDLYEEYKKLTPETVKAFGGKFVVRGGNYKVLEGDWKPERIVILEFPSAEKADAWWASEDYTRARLIRQRAATTRMILLNSQ